MGDEMIKRFAWVAVTLAMMGLPLSGSAQSLMAGVAAVVNNDIVTTTELARAVGLAKQRIIASGQALPKEEELVSAVLHHLIDLRLQLQLAKRLNVTKSNQEVDQAIARIKHTQHLSDKLFAEKLAEEGRTEKALRAEIHEQLVLNAVQQRALGSKLRITEPQVAEFKKHFIAQSTQYMMQDILVQIPEDADFDAKKTALIKAKQIQQMLKSGKALPKQVEDMVYNEPDWRSLDELPSVFANVLVKQQIGDTASPILAPNGYHVVRLIDKRHQDLTDTQAHQLLMQKRYNEAYPKWIGKLRDSAYVKIKLRHIDGTSPA